MTDFTEKTGLWCSLASQILGWRPDDFWRATPAELSAAIRPIEPRLGISGPNRDVIDLMLERDSNG